MDEQNVLGNMALHEALSGGHTEVAEVLLAAGANATLCDAAGRQCSFVVGHVQALNPCREMIHSHLLKVDGVDPVDAFSRTLLELVRSKGTKKEEKEKVMEL